MNTRSIIYLVLMAVLFLGMNFFFTYQNDQKNRLRLAQMQEQKAQEMQANRAEYEKRIAELKDLPLVSLGEHSGVLAGSDILTIAWSEKQPQTVTANNQTFSLYSKQIVPNAPVLYGSSKLQAVSIPDRGRFDLQLVTLNKQPEVFLAEVNDGVFNLLSGFPPSNAIALYKEGSNYVPVGFYETRNRAYIPLQKVPVLANLFEENKPLASEAHSGQQFFVLENPYQQVVFSNIGGAITEINLPFHSKKNPYSVVNEINADREIEKDSPANDYFPQESYITSDGKTHSKGQEGGFYPLLRRSIEGGKQLSPEFYALNLVSDYPEVAELNYSVKEFTNDKIVFEATQPHRRITKTYTLVPGSEGAPYVLNLDLNIAGDTRGLWLTSGVPDVEIVSKNASPVVQYRTLSKNKSVVEKVHLPKAGETISVGTGHPQWMITSNGYLGMILDPLTPIGTGFKVRGVSGAEAPTRLSLINPRYEPYPASKYPGYQLLLPIPSSGGNFNFRIYAGPIEQSTLKAVDKMFGSDNPHYIDARSTMGFFRILTAPIAKVLFLIMEFFHLITGSWGWSIILLTVVLRLVLYPLTAWSFKSMKRMQLLSPKVKAIQARYKSDPKRMQIEIMTLYRENKTNPFMGCLPVLIQFPFFLGMFDVLKSSFQLRGACFIPGWIDNLTAPDVLFSWKTPIFFIGNQLHLLPILLGVVMFFQQRMSLMMRKQKDEELTDQERQQKTMGTVMTLVFSFMFYNFASGLNLYWLSSMLLGILQQWITFRKMDNKNPHVEVMAPGKKGRK